MLNSKARKYSPMTVHVELQNPKSKAKTGRNSKVSKSSASMHPMSMTKIEALKQKSKNYNYFIDFDVKA